MAFSLSEQETLGYLNLSLFSLSFVSSLFILLCYFLFERLRSFAFRLVTLIALSDCLYSIGHLLGNLEDGPFCHIQAYIITYFELVSLLVTVLIARSLQRVFLQGDLQVEEDEKWYIIAAWTLPWIVLFLPESTDSYGPSGTFCWIKGHSSIDTAWRFVIFYIWLWSGILYILYVYYNISKKYSFSQSMNQDDINKSKVISRMKYYPLTLIICYFFASINRVYLFVAPQNPSFVLSLLHLIFVSLKGVVNSVIYGYTGNAGSTLKSWLLDKLHGCRLCLSVSSTDPSYDDKIDSRNEVLHVEIDDHSPAPTSTQMK